MTNRRVRASRALAWALTMGAVLASALVVAALVLMGQADPRADVLALAALLVGALTVAVVRLTAVRIR